MDFLKLIYENVEKKKTFISQVYLYLRVTDILKFSEVLFWTYWFDLSLRNSHYAYLTPYMHKTLPTLGNEKEQ